MRKRPLIWRYVNCDPAHRGNRFIAHTKSEARGQFKKKFGCRIPPGAVFKSFGVAKLTTLF